MEYWKVKLSHPRIKYVGDPNPVDEFETEEIKINDLIVKVGTLIILWWEIKYILTPTGKKLLQKDLFPKWRTDPENLPTDL